MFQVSIKLNFKSCFLPAAIAANGIFLSKRPFLVATRHRDHQKTKNTCYGINISLKFLSSMEVFSIQRLSNNYAELNMIEQMPNVDPKVKAFF